MVDHQPERGPLPSRWVDQNGAMVSAETTSTSMGGTDGGVEMDAEHITTSTRDPQELAGQLQEWLVGQLGEHGQPTITEVSSPESNGMSSETLLFTARWTEEGVSADHRLVARIEPPSTAYPVFTTYDLDMQFRVMRLVADHTSVPVPQTLWFEPDPGVLGGPFFVMARVDGLVPPDVLPYTFGDNWGVRRLGGRPGDDPRDRHRGDGRHPLDHS